MEGRRHSVDIPIAKSLVALRRVRSLRDPSTLSMSKFSSLLDNVNWETNSNNNGVSLRFLESCQEDDYGKNRGSRLRNVDLYSSRDDHVDEFEFNLYENSEKMGNYARSRNSHVEGLGHRRSYEEEISKKKSLSERYLGNQIDKMCVIPSINPLEDVDSSNEPSIGSLQQIMDKISMQRKFETKNQANNSFGAIDDGTSCVGSVSSRSEEADDVECGVSCCWSGTPRFREPEMESNPLLSRNVNENNSVYSKRFGNEIIPHLETPRSLSQKFRPKCFSELVGQNVVARSLLGAIHKGRVTSLYLFHGPRGTGKTSASRIFAAALNCLSSDERRPCGLCRECAIFFSGRSRDVKEVDSVRINKRERARSLIKRATVPPVSSRFKVFIVDECHLLHGETWATVMHGLEGLSQNVVFIMITSELDKLPRSAVSRAQRYHFPKIKDSDVSSRLAKICTEECLDFDEAALDFIASKSSGSMRDAEMLLDQLSLLGRKITLSLAYELIGIVSDDELLDLLDLAMSSDTSKTVIRARELMRSRIDPMQLISQLANIIMDILAGCQEGCSEIRKTFSSRHTSEMDLQKLSNALKILSETEKQLRVSKNQTTWLTVALLQLSSLECSSTEMNNSKLWVTSPNDRGEGLKHVVSSREEHNLETLDDHKKTLELIWKRAVELCQSTSLRKFLMEQGRLSSLLVSQGVAVADLEFCHPDCITMVEKSQHQIVNSLQSILGCNVDIRISLIPYASKSMYSKVKKASLRLFGCSRRIHKSQSSLGRGTSSDYSAYTSERPIIMPISCDCASQVSNKCGDRSDISMENNTPTPALVSVASNERGCDTITEALSFRRPKNRTKCFPQSFRRHKKLRSSGSSQMVHCAKSEDQNNLALAIMRRTSFDTSAVDTSHSNIFYNSSNNYTTGSIDDNKLRENSQDRFCWRTPKIHIRKGWRSRHQQEGSQSVRWVLPCTGGK